MTARISVIIVSFNGRPYLVDCFRSLEKQTMRPEEIIIIDNCSTDGTGDYLKNLKLSSEIKLKIILNEKNLGFAKANNQGMKIALKGQADYIFLLNQDTKMEPNCLEELLKAAGKQEDLFALQPLILCWPEKNKVQTSGDRIHFLGFGHLGNYGLSAFAEGYGGSTEGGKIREIPYASGAAMFLKRKTLEEVGFFDEDLFMYHEDMDLCLRARLLGKKILLAPAALVYHHYSGKMTSFKWIWSERNRQLMLLKFYKLPTLILIFPFWLLMEIGSLFYSALLGALNLKIRGYFEILGLLPKFLRKRREIQKTRKIKDKELFKYLDGEFKFALMRSPLFYLINPILGSSWKMIKNIVFW